MPLPSWLRILTLGDSSVIKKLPTMPHSLHHLPGSPQLQVARLSTPGLDAITLSQHCSQIAHVLQPFMPHTCRWLSPEDVKLIGDHPIAAGGFADIWEAVHDGRKVVLKSRRCYVLFDIAQAARVRCNCHPTREVPR